jgi:RNA recognition motif-containing protein
VGNLSYSTTESTLSDLSIGVGEVQSVSLITDGTTGSSKGFAFIEMSDDAKAQEAINQLNEREVDGRTIKVAEARSKRDDRGGRGGRGGRQRRDRW